MKAFLIVCFACLALPVWAGVGVESIPATQPAPAVTLDVSVSTGATAYAPTQPSTQRVTVQRVAQLRQLEWWENEAIRKFRCDFPTAIGSAERATFLVQIDQSHVEKLYDKCGRLIGGRLNRSPKDYDADYQIFTQLYNRTDWYVNMPGLPPFMPGQRVSLEPAVLPTDFCQVAAVCASATGSVRFGREESYRESQLGIFGGFTSRKCSPPDNPNCPEEGPGPGGGPTPPPGPLDVP